MVRDGMKIPLFDEIALIERLEELICFVLDGGYVPSVLHLQGAGDE